MKVLLSVLLSTFVFLGCELETPDAVSGDKEVAEFCTLDTKASAKGSLGNAWVFNIDPIFSAGGSVLLPTSRNLDSYRSEYELNRLKGTGRLEGAGLEVRDGLYCSDGFGAYEETQDFDYSREDPRFGEAMAYTYGEHFREHGESAQITIPTKKFELIAHCMWEDNAYFMRWFDSSAESRYEVCIGTSASTPGASYAEDAHVVLHEMQHGVTAAAYDSEISFNQLMYDEAGAINEGMSDFVALLMSQASQDLTLFDGLFSRWALKFFESSWYSHRGIDICPEYDRTESECRVKFVYPDGLGWPYANNYGVNPSLQKVFENFSYKEEIHNNSIIVSGALWDAARALDFDSSIYRWLVETVQTMPLPSIEEPVPVSIGLFFRTFYQIIENEGVSSSRLTALRNALELRGVLNMQTLGNDWAEFDESRLIWVDRPKSLRDWMMQRGYDPSLIPNRNETGLNRKPNPGEWAAVWFNIKNKDFITAGNVRVRLVSLSPHLQILGPALNDGYISEESAEIVYSKINGSQIISTLSDVSMGQDYQSTIRNIDKGAAQTAIWVYVSKEASAGSTLPYRIEVRAENAPQFTYEGELEVQ